MDKLEWRIDRTQAETVLNALELAAKATAAPSLAAEYEQLWSWLTHRYTRKWGLPPRVANAAHGRAAGGQ